jgi:hypothetical protein
MTRAFGLLLLCSAFFCGLGCSKASAQATFPELDPKAAKEETWIMDEVGKTEVLVFANARVTLGKSCLKGAVLDCDALRTLKAGAAVEVKKSQLDGRMSAGMRVCQALKNELVNGKAPSGNEDAFCKFKDGSLVSAGALETYALKIVP